MSRKIRNFLKKSQIQDLSPPELIKYKKELETIYFDIREEVESFIVAYAVTKKTMQTKLASLENLLDALEEFRLTTSDLDNNMHFLNIQ